MKSLVESIFGNLKQLDEGIFGDNVKSKIVPEKLAYVLRKFFGQDIALCKDYQGSTEWYEINPSTMKIDNVYKLKDRIIKYCEKINNIKIKEEKIPSFNPVKVVHIGDDTYWFRLDMVKYSSNRVMVSKEFYDSMALPHDQKGVTQRGWDEWQRQRL